MTEGIEFEIADEPERADSCVFIPDHLINAARAQTGKMLSVLDPADPMACALTAVKDQAEMDGWGEAMRANTGALTTLLEHTKKYNLPRTFMSYSQVNLFKICGERYRRSYVEDQPRGSSSNMAHGKMIHSVVEDLNRAKLTGEYNDWGSSSALQYANDRISEHMATAALGIETWDPKVPDAQLFESSARDLVQIYVQERLPNTLPKALEVRVIDCLNGSVPFQGYIDMVEHSIMAFVDENGEVPDILDLAAAQSTAFSASDKIVDLKNTGKTYGEGRVANSLQLSLYSKITGAERVGYDLLVQTKVPKFVQQEAWRTPPELEHAADVVEDVARSISAGIFPRTDPESWVCSSKWCEYFSDCRERRRGAQTTVTSEVVDG